MGSHEIESNRLEENKVAKNGPTSWNLTDLGFFDYAIHPSPALAHQYGAIRV